MNKKVFWGTLLAIVVIGMIYLTLQSPEQTTMLSGRLRDWLNNHGLTCLSMNIRSDIHLVEVFIFGIFLALFGISMRWPILLSFLVGSCIGLFDETVKIALPTREFDGRDLVKDLIGVILAIVIVYTIAAIKKKDTRIIHYEDIVFFTVLHTRVDSSIFSCHGKFKAVERDGA